MAKLADLKPGHVWEGKYGALYVVLDPPAVTYTPGSPSGWGHGPPRRRPNLARLYDDGRTAPDAYGVRSSSILVGLYAESVDKALAKRKAAEVRKMERLAERLDTERRVKDVAERLTAAGFEARAHNMTDRWGGPRVVLTPDAAERLANVIDGLPAAVRRRLVAATPPERNQQ